jgi:GNAT superfamily N-acetyltransferase
MTLSRNIHDLAFGGTVASTCDVHPELQGDSVVRNSGSPSSVSRGLRMITDDDGMPILESRAQPGSFLPDVTVRPLTRGDVRPLQQVFDGLSPASRSMRFLGATPSLSPALARRLADVDHDTHGCWVAEISGQPVGIGRYIRTAEDPAVAEIALEVVDSCQGHGLGRLLVDVVGAAAADVGVTSLLWLMDETNRRVRRLAAPLGGRFTREDGVLEGTTALPMVSLLDDALIARCARCARRQAADRTAA